MTKLCIDNVMRNAGVYTNSANQTFEGEFNGGKPVRRCPLPPHVKQAIANIEVSNIAVTWTQYLVQHFNDDQQQEVEVIKHRKIVTEVRFF